MILKFHCSLYAIFSCLTVMTAICHGNRIKRGLGSDDEVRLVNDLFGEKSGYNPLIRPVENVNDTLTVAFNVALSQLINIDEKNQIMKTNVWLQMYWHDYQIRWDPSLYGGIKNIRIDHEKIWRPDIVLFNNADGNYEVSYKSNVVLNFSGDHYWVPPAIYKSSCTIDVQYFPFDQQICEMKFGSWTFKGDQLQFKFYMNMDFVDPTDYLKSGTWDIIEFPGKIQRINDTESHDYKYLIVFKFILRRKTLFYTVNLIIPCVLISFVSICVFALPADAGEKITLCISILLALVVFLLLISKILPPSLKIPLIAKYLLFTFIMNIFAICLTVVVINRNYRTPRTHKMPYWVRFVFLYMLPKLLFLERPNHDIRWRHVNEQTTSNQANQVKQQQQVHQTSYFSPEHHQVSSSRQSSLLELTEIHHPSCRLSPNQINCEMSDENGEQFPKRVTAELHKATEALSFITCHLETENEFETVLDDWRYVALVIDRLLFYVFLIVTIGGTLGILMQAPHILEFVDQDEIIENVIRKINTIKN
ncbi:acetylcholine receptor subunit beta-like 1 [Mytilus galloprovincialis]|uniref:acetylcholine receptor subunit beta-like 1 n=1 Tax=Mytilus galloprovincialis TaxID=29158 RepID=UPI003F7BB832